MLQSNKFVVVSNVWMLAFLCVHGIYTGHGLWSFHLHLLWTMYYKNLHITWWLTSFPTPVWAGAPGTKGL